MAAEYRFGVTTGYRLPYNKHKPTIARVATGYKDSNTDGEFIEQLQKLTLVKGDKWGIEVNFS